MKATALACVATLSLICTASLPAAHGGTYRGPGDTVPPNDGSDGGNGGRRTGPTTPTPGGPTAPAPRGPSTGYGGGPGTGPGTGGTGGGPRGRNPRTGGLGVGGVDLAGWETWWEFNKDPFLGLKAAIHSDGPSTGLDDLLIGKGYQSRLSTRLAPSSRDRARVRDALQRILADRDTHQDIASSCMIALAKIGGDGKLVGLLMPYLDDANQEKRETAVLAMGIAALDEAIVELEALARDDKRGRRLVKRRQVDYRTRSFACYGLGLTAWSNKSLEVKTRVFETMRAILDDDRRSRRDVKVAALNALRLLRLEQSGEIASDLHARVEAYLDAFSKRKDDEPALVRSHAITALAGIVRPGSPSARKLAKRLTKLLSTRRAKHWVQQAATIALGRIAKAEDEQSSRALKTYADGGRDLQARRFALIALGRIGGPKNRAFLRNRLRRSRTQKIERPWISIALALAAHEARKADSSPPLDNATAEIRDQFERSTSPILAAGHAIALGILRDREAGDSINERLLRWRTREDAAGYFALSLGLLGHREARTSIWEVLEGAKRRPNLLAQTATALGLLRDKEATPRLLAKMRSASSLVVQAALAQAVGFIGDRRSIPPLLEMLEDEKVRHIPRAFAVVALGIVADKEPLPWNSKIAVGANYRANVETLTGNGSTGILDIL